MRKKDRYEDMEEQETPAEEAEEEEYEDEYEWEEEDGKPWLRIIIVSLIVCALLVAAFFVIRHIRAGRAERDYGSEVVVTDIAEEDMDDMDLAMDDTDMESDMDDMEDADMDDMNDIADDMDLAIDDMDMEIDMEEETGSAPDAVTVTPDTATELLSIPEKYVIPGIDGNDLTAVRSYIQTKLDAIAADLNCPNIDEITANEDCTVFTALLNSIDESVAEQEAVNTIYELGRTYAAYAGKTVDNIRIEYKNHVGDMLWVRDSKS